MGISGDFSRLRVVLQRVSPERVAQVKAGLIANLAEEALTQIKLGFEGGRDPNGKTWKPLARPRRRDAAGTTGIPLNDTGRLKNSWTRLLRPDGFTWSSNVVYAAAHNYGADILHRPRTNVHSARGRFMSRRQADRRKGGAVRVSFAGAVTQHLPARPMIPERGELPPMWRNAFDNVIRRTLVGYGLGG